MADDDILLLLLPESGAALLVWPDGRAVRVERDGTPMSRDVRDRSVGVDRRRRGACTQSGVRGHRNRTASLEFRAGRLVATLSKRRQKRLNILGASECKPLPG